MTEFMYGTRSVIPICASLFKIGSLRFPSQTALSLKNETFQIIGPQGCQFT